MSSPCAIRACKACGAWQSYPRPVCQVCGSRQFRESVEPETGVIYSSTTVHRAGSPTFHDKTPYTIALVEGAKGGLLLLPIDNAEGRPKIGDVVNVVLALDGLWAGAIVGRMRNEQAT